uniref:Uncharacterized protein n=1 Tax=Setaria viridis TaxID=4556 RepID=A0A4U6SUJ7_SETVI|nr:hypothetical protein SEVIR_9G112400v2 [Setaria viridis]
MLRRWDRGRRDPPKEAPGHGAGGWTKAARHRWRLRESSSSGSGPRVCKRFALVTTGNWKLLKEKHMKQNTYQYR